MKLEERLIEDMRAALKDGQKVRVSVLRMAIAAVKNRKIDLMADSLEDKDVIALLQKTVRQHKESIDKFGVGGRDDLVAQETEEMAILEGYLPKQMSAGELAVIVDEAINRTGATSLKDMGAVMNDVMSVVKGRADGKAISSVAREKLT